MCSIHTAGTIISTTYENRLTAYHPRATIWATRSRMVPRMSRDEERRAIAAAIAAGRLHRITPAEAAAHRAAREATAAARRRSVGMFFGPHGSKRLNG